jgi:hypothetical protein
MEPQPALDMFRRREIEQQLAADLQAANQKLRKALTMEDKREAADGYLRALNRFTEFASKGLVPEGLLRSEEPPDNNSSRV